MTLRVKLELFWIFDLDVQVAYVPDICLRNGMLRSIAAYVSGSMNAVRSYDSRRTNIAAEDSVGRRFPKGPSSGEEVHIFSWMLPKKGKSSLFGFSVRSFLKPSFQDDAKHTPDDGSSDVPSTPPKSPPPTQPKALSPSKANIAPKRSEDELLHSLKKALVGRKKPVESPSVSDRSIGSASPWVNDTVLLIPDTSTPIVNSNHRSRIPAKPHRLILADPLPKDQNNDDSLFASVDVDALVDDARKRRSTTGIGGTQFKRCKTTGDLSNDEIKKTLQKALTVRRVDQAEDDSFFMSQDVLAEVDKLVKLSKFQRKT